MANKPSSKIYAIVEKAYFRLQAGDVLTHCIEDGSSNPIHEMIQDLILAGPQSLEALREILAEANKRKTQVYDDLNQVTNQLSIILKGYGVNLEEQGGNQVLQNLTEDQLVRMMDGQGVLEPGMRANSMQVMRDSQELIHTLYSKIILLESIETYLQDWLWGLTYQSMRQPPGNSEDEISSKPGLL
jgi:hypothetical protein